jgi:NTE family protein
MLNQLPPGLREQAAQIAPCLLPHGLPTPGYFDVFANSINIMQDYITRARLAGEPPQVMLVPRLRHIGLMEFNRAKEAIAGGAFCVEQALPMIRRFVWGRPVWSGPLAGRVGKFQG